MLHVERDGIEGRARQHLRDQRIGHARPRGKDGLAAIQTLDEAATQGHDFMARIACSSISVMERRI